MPPEMPGLKSMLYTDLLPRTGQCPQRAVERAIGMIVTVRMVSMLRVI
ncbi:hypothetical protein SAMN02982927_03067 [Sporolactobacillus nakayamae]|uniref:Uncharacterized protein n=1 Tax=Sporolactobacillus nakayamae TaxID=269670 RepID=A0A1I2VE46_9BACL|nr:hypothetical protein SAMN02982927_03067 [Sporolactobacillus nakayamae]